MRASPKPVMLSLEKSGVLDHCNVPVLEACSIAACPSMMSDSPGSLLYITEVFSDVHWEIVGFWLELKATC